MKNNVLKPQTKNHRNKIRPLTDAEIQRSTYIAILLGLFLPPAVGATIMGIVGFYPFPEIYLIFTSYTGLYVAAVVAVTLALTPRAVRFVIALTSLELETASTRAQRALTRLPWFMLGCVTIYSIFGALTADLSIEQMGYRDYSLRDHLYNQFGLIPVILITAFPIFFFYVDHLGRYLGPRGISTTAIPLWVKLLMLGIVTPLLIDSLLIGYYLNRTGYFEWQTLVLWGSLLLLATGGTWLAWRSMRQGLEPLQAFVATSVGPLPERARTTLTPLSLDELGVLTTRFAEMLTNQQRAEHLANTLVTASPVVVYRCRAHGDYGATYISPNVIEQMELRPEQFTENSSFWAERIHPDDRPRVFQELGRLFEQGRHQHEYRFMFGDGTYRWVHDQLTLRRDDAGNPIDIVGAMINVDERKVIERTLHESEERLRLAMSAASQGFYDLDLRTGDAVVSPEYATMLGYDPADFKETNEFWRQRLHPDDQQTVYQVYSDYVSGKRSDYRVEFRQRTRGGDWKWILSLGQIMARDSEGRPLRMLGTHTDITDRKLAEEALRLSEKSYRLLFENMMAGVVVQDASGKVIEANPAACDILGLSMDQMMGRTAYDERWRLIKEDGTPQQPGEMPSEVALRTGQSVSNFLTGIFIPEKEDYRWILINSTPVKDDKGKSISTTTIFLDITELKRNEAELRNHREHLEELVTTRAREIKETNQMLHTVLDTAPLRIFWKDTKLNYLGCNQVFAQDAGKQKPEDLIGKSDYDMAWKATADLYREDDARVIHSGVAKLSFEEPMDLPDGSRVWLSTSKVPLRNAEGEIIGVLGTYENITARRLAQQELVAAKESAERANNAKSEFLSRMSHELRTPMNAILGFAQILESEPISAEQRDFAQEIVRAGSHLLELIDELLDLSRIEAGKMLIVLQQVPVREAVVDAIKLAQPVVARSGIQVANHCSVDATALADPTRLRQILLNLITNAAKYNRTGGRIDIECRQHDHGRIRISIRDTGPGIEPEKIGSLFRPFERLGAEFRAVEGAGIGLALSKRLTEMMNGTIGVESRPGQGSTFWIDLPATQSERKPDIPDRPVPLVGVARRTILYVEDNAANLRVIEAIFRRHGDLNLISAANGEFGLELARRYKPDAILLDIHLPGMDGYAVLDALRANEITCAIPAIALSADAMPNDIEKGLAAGFACYLTKPVNVRDLLEAIHNVMDPAKTIST